MITSSASVTTLSPHKKSTQKRTQNAELDIDKFARQRDRVIQRVTEILRNGEQFKTATDETVIHVHQLALNNKEWATEYATSLVDAAGPQNLQNIASGVIPEIVKDYERTSSTSYSHARGYHLADDEF